MFNDEPDDEAEPAAIANRPAGYMIMLCLGLGLLMVIGPNYN